jgi:hypothetical protein
VLFAAMGAFFLIRDNERLFEAAKSIDKEFIVVEGASHFIKPNRPSERFPVPAIARAIFSILRANEF